MIINECKSSVVLPDGTTAFLTAHELKICMGLAARPGWIRTPDQIILMYHRDEWDASHESVRSHIRRLRAKIGHDLIINRTGQGYSWTEDVPTQVIRRE